MDILTFDTTEKLLLIALGVFFIIQLLYYLCLYNRILRRNRAVQRDNVNFTETLPPISVIICAREESDNLRRNLVAVLEQDYPQFEVIVINNGNTDESEEYLTQLEDKYAHLYHSFVPDSSRYISRKKLAVTLGIKASKYDWLVFTHANCRPQSNQWLRLMARNFTPRAQIVLGYSDYEQGKGWLQKRVSFDNLFTSMRYLGCALAGKPYMGIGRNMAYRKQLFYDQKGFSAHLNLQRGDDDLFINQVATADNTRVETAAESVVQMQPVVRGKEWREEKIGYASTARLYRGSQRYLLGFETLTRLLFHATWTVLLAFAALHTHWIAAATAILLFLIRATLQGIIINHTARILGEKRSYYFTLPVFDLLQPLQSLRWKLHCLFRKRSEFLRK